MNCNTTHYRANSSSVPGDPTDIDTARFPETVSLGRQVFQFPCHQEMTAADLEWLADTVRRELLSASSVARSA